MSIAVLRLSVALWLIGASLAANAGDSFSRREYPQAYRNKHVAAHTTVWYCASSGNSSVLCRLGNSRTKTFRQQSVRNSDLPAMARYVIEEPESLTDWPVEIPLYAPPFDFELVGQLAEYVMCGNKEHCGIIFGETPAQLEQLVRWHESRPLAGSARDSVL